MVQICLLNKLCDSLSLWTVVEVDGGCTKRILKMFLQPVCKNIYNAETSVTSACRHYTNTDKHCYSYPHMHTLYSTGEYTCPYTYPNTLIYTVENEIQVDAGVFIFFCSQQGVWGVEKLKTRPSKHTHTHTPSDMSKERAPSDSVCWCTPKTEPLALGYAGSLSRGQRSL